MIVDHARNEQVLIALRRITHAIDAHSRSIFLHHSLTGSQFFLMRDISRVGGLPVGEFLEHAEMDAPEANDILDRLEKRGLIRKDRDAEGGAEILSVTEPGMVVLRNAPPLPRERFFEEYGRLNEWEQSLILSILQRVAVMLEGGPDTVEVMGSESPESSETPVRMA